MKRIALLLPALVLLATGCQRSSREFWEDTKTAGHYIGKGMRSFLGKHSDSREYAGWRERYSEQDYIPLADTETFEGPTMHDYGPSKESPGDPGSRIPGIDAFIVPVGKMAALFKNVQFDTDDYSVKGKSNVALLSGVAEYLISHPTTYIFIEGHADERGASAYNLALGSRRANSIRTFLIQNGVPQDQLFTISYGKERPLVGGHDESTWQKNRRGQFKLHES